MKKVAFFTQHMNELGTESATYDYAYYNKKILGNESIIFYKKNRPTELHFPNTFNSVLAKYKKEFEVIGLDKFDDIHQILTDKHVDAFYVLKGGEVDEFQTSVCKCCIHCVWGALPNTKHGDVYADINVYQAKKNGTPYVPHMVNLPDVETDMRAELNIPGDALIIGSYGAREALDLTITKTAIYNIAKSNKNIYFLFANINKFCEPLENIIHLGTIVDLEEKSRFINTADAMIHGRSVGETFGLAIADFSSKNKPVITASKRHIYGGTVDGALMHLNILGEKAIIYDTQEELEHIFSTLDKNLIKSKDWNAYTDYTPEKVINLFKEVFLDD